MDITLYQQDIVWGEPEANRRRVERALAAAPQSDIFIVPETFTTGFGTHMASLAEPALGPTLRWAQQMSARHNLLFIGTWIVSEGHRCYNRLHWVFPDGSYDSYDKAHTFRPSGEHDQISRGTERRVFAYKGWRIRPAVCYDLRFPTWLRNDGLAHSHQPIPAQALQSDIPSPSSRGQVLAPASPYDLLLVCANWPASRREAWSTLLKARAIENLCYVAGCNRTGLDGNGGLYSGDSAIIDYKGFPVSESLGNGEEGTIATTLHLDKLQAFRQKWPLYLDFD